MPASPTLVSRWLLPVLWVTLPFTAGPLLATALDERSRPVQLVGSLGLWAAWAVALAAMGVPRTTSLTVVRTIVPASLLAVLVAATTTEVAARTWLALTVTLAATVWCLTAPVGDTFVNGSSYGHERRFPLRPPTAVLLGPLPLTWLAVVLGATVGPLLLASRQWAAGVIATAIGVAVVLGGVRILHGLSRRWIVLVPAGVVLHDLSAMADPLLVPTRDLARIGPAEVGTDAEDLTLGATGLALELRFREPMTFAPRPARGRAVEVRDTMALLCTPSRPGAVLRACRDQKLPVG